MRGWASLTFNQRFRHCVLVIIGMFCFVLFIGLIYATSTNFIMKTLFLLMLLGAFVAVKGMLGARELSKRYRNIAYLGPTQFTCSDDNPNVSKVQIVIDSRNVKLSIAQQNNL